MIHVQIVDPEHKHAGEVGILSTKRTVHRGRVLIVRIDKCMHNELECEVEKTQIKAHIPVDN